MTISLLEHAEKKADEAGVPKPYGLVWTLKAVRPDLRARGDYRWPFPGCWAECDAPDVANTFPCPSVEGDGLCVALTWRGMAQGGTPAHTLLLLGYSKEAVLGADRDKARVTRAYVRDVLDGARLVREHGIEAHLAGANLERADLERAGLRRAYLEGANLEGANLAGANLERADLERADLERAYLRGAQLGGANLGSAYLRGADLRRADLKRAYLGDTDLAGANLEGANLAGANLERAYLEGADLAGANFEKANLGEANFRGANLGRTNFRGARHTGENKWPAGFDPATATDRKANGG